MHSRSNAGTDLAFIARKSAEDLLVCVDDGQVGDAQLPIAALALQAVSMKWQAQIDGIASSPDRLLALHTVLCQQRSGGSRINQTVASTSRFDLLLLRHAVRSAKDRPIHNHVVACAARLLAECALKADAVERLVGTHQVRRIPNRLAAAGGLQGCAIRIKSIG